LKHNRTAALLVNVPLWNPGHARILRDKATVEYYWESVRTTMTSLCGVSRHQERLLAAESVLKAVRKNIHDFYWTYRVSKDFLEVRNIADVANAIIQSALARKESRACHFREDFPRRNDSQFRRLTLVNSQGNISFRPISL
jgi:L-aspartate oxidase